MPSSILLQPLPLVNNLFQRSNVLLYIGASTYLPPDPIFDLLAMNAVSKFSLSVFNSFFSPQLFAHFVFNTVMEPRPSVLIFVSLMTVLPPSIE